ncbi:MAG: hypothetical protein K9J17_13105 [Flavobacteriales bacterium]|nr:hypothetical protein [Flavobacteriales bacterium]
MRNFLFLFAALVLGTVQFAQAQQLKSFTHDNEKYITELQEFFAMGDPKAAKKLIEETFLPVWNSGHYSPQQKERVYKISDLMLKEKKKAVDFENYLFALMSFAKSMKPASDFDAFHDGLEKTITQLSRKQFTEYLEVCKSLFTDYILYDSQAVKWVAKFDAYKIQFDSLPKIVFGKLDLKAYSKRDSSIIYGTQGVYYPTLTKWVGKGGKIDWSRAGFDPAKTYADIGNYTVDATKSTYSIDSVTFYHPDYLDRPHIGVLTEKILADVDEESASYPRFDSYDKRILIKDMYKDIDYSGGFSQHGIKFIGSGDADQDATLIFKKMNHLTKKNENFIAARSKSFVIRPDKVLSKKAEVSFYYEGDSIYHPGIRVDYNVEKHEVVFAKDKEGSGRSPFYDTYHKVDMHVDAITWNMSADWMTLQNTTGGAESSAMFESDDYYDEYRYDRIRGTADIHPLWKIRNYAKELGMEELTVEQVARLFKSDISETKVFLINLSNSGFMTYNYEKDLVMLKPRLHHYVLARSKKTDYDILQFESIVDGLPNAKLNLLNWDMDMNGVGRIFLSDSQDVIVFPYEQELTLKKNRDFLFNGKVVGGRLDFFGSDFYFSYDDFKITMNQVDSLRLKVPDGTPDDSGRQPLRAVKTVLRDLKGELLVDRPDNKSGLKDHPRYPVFNSTDDSFVYYDKRSIQDGAYKKEEFYMHLKPFSIDSLENFTKEGLAFDGNFVSAGIFPDFEETLRLQPDFSLGFVRETPPEGLDTYGGKGKYKATIKLSHEGLRGDGNLEYLTSISKSDDFLFYPDSVNGVAQDFVINKQKSPTPYPPVTGVDSRVHWEPKLDHFYAYKLQNPFDMYEGEVTHHGGLDLSPKGLDGFGNLDFADSYMRSNRFNFKYRDFHADTADFKLKGASENSYAFKTSNVRMDISLDDRQGKFKSNTGGDFVDFPVNQYICYIDEFKWNIDQKNIDVVSDGEGSRYVSTNPKQDSLEFRSPLAKFNLDNFIISAKKVDHIDVADAIIYPDSGNVTIREQAAMDPLGNSRIVANRITKFHTFYESTVNVLGKWKYNAKGKYDYEDVTGKKQLIEFAKIGIDSAGQTFGEGIIAEEAAFTLSPNFDYKGKAKLFASQEFLTYDGSTRIKHDCPGITRDWLAFDADIDPKNIYIPIPAEPKDANGMPMSSGVVISKDSTTVYPTFLSKKIKPNDIDIVAAEGYLHFDNESQEYRISNKEKLQGAVVGGNYLSLSNECIARGQGKLNMGMDFGQVELTPLGTVEHNMNNDSTKFNLFLGIDFFFNDESLRIMAEKISNHFPPLDAVFYGTEYEKALIELVGKDETTKLIQELNLYGTFKKLPKELEKTMFLTDVELVWNPTTGSYRYKGFIGISSVGKFQVNKMVYGLVELTKKRNGDELSVYFEPSDDSWFFFNYKRGMLGAFSSNDDFNAQIRDTKDDKRTQKGEKGKPNITYVLSTAIQRRNFVRSFEE